MTIHKIDREKLAEALDNCFVHQTIDGDALTVCADSKIDTAQIIKKAAENWLAITDPGFEVSEKMINNVIGFDLKGTMTDSVEIQAYCTHVKKIMLESIFKSMIATMIKGE